MNETYKYDFMECDTCRAKPGSPTLCSGCLHNRLLISELQKDKGMDVKIKFKKDSPFGNTEEVLHNITEIHYLYPTALLRKRIAFESDVHSTGNSIDVSSIDEFEAKVSKEISKLY